MTPSRHKLARRKSEQDMVHSLTVELSIALQTLEKLRARGLPYSAAALDLEDLLKFEDRCQEEWEQFKTYYVWGVPAENYKQAAAKVTTLPVVEATTFLAEFCQEWELSPESTPAKTLQALLDKRPVPIAV